MTVYKESGHWCRDKRGNRVIVIIQNLGWSNLGGYVTRFLFEGHYHEAMFPSPKASESVCPTPEIRLAFDMECIERLGLMYEDEIA